MASVHGYITLAELELFAIEDYSAKSSSYIDDVIDAQISQAERIVNIYCGQTFAGTIPEGVVAVTLELSRRFMHNRMVSDGIFDRDHIPDLQETIIKNDEGLMDLLEAYIFKTIDDDATVDIIPMTRNERNWY